MGQVSGIRDQTFSGVKWTLWDPETGSHRRTGKWPHLFFVRVEEAANNNKDTKFPETGQCAGRQRREEKGKEGKRKKEKR